MNKKLYAQPELAVVNINKHDIIVTSDPVIPTGGEGSANDAEAPGMRWLDWE